MASGRSLWHDVEVVSHWRKVGALGMEEALRQTGCSESVLSAVMRQNVGLRYMGGQYWTSFLRELRDEASETLSATILATVGREGGGDMELILTNLDLTEMEAVAFCVNISSNTNFKELTFNTTGALCTVAGCIALGGALASNSTLRALRFYLDSELIVNIDAFRIVVDGLWAHKTLSALSLSPLRSSGPLTTGCVAIIAEYLRYTSALESLFMPFDLDTDDETAELISSALSQNTSLRSITFKIKGGHNDRVAKLLLPFSGQASDDTASLEGKNYTLEKLDLRVGEATGDLLAAVVHFIRTNKSLSSLHIMIDLSPQEWKEQIFRALKANETLAKLDFWMSKGMEGEDVFEALMDMLQDNDSKSLLRSVRVRDTGLQSKQPQIDEELRINSLYRSALRGQKLETTTFGRLVMCGFQYAGKTTISESLQQIDKGTNSSHPLRRRWKRFLQQSPALVQFLFGRDAYLELQQRTRGCDILVLHNQHQLKAIWDFAGQREYYALHDYLFPDMKNSCFLYVCSALTVPTKKSPEGSMKKINEMKDEFEFWLKFVASNSKPFFVGNGGGQRLPVVIFVLTKTDILGNRDARVSKGWVQTVVHELKVKFKDVVDLCDDVQVVNALDQKDVTPLLTVVSDHLKKTLQHQTEYTICRGIREIFSRWASENPLKPVLGLEMFNTLCKERFFPDQEVPLGSQEQWEVVLAYLDDVGEIIFVKGLSFIVTNPRWFGVGILGYLIDAFKGVQVKNGGILGCFFSTVDHDSIPSGVFPDQGVVESSRMKILLEDSLEMMRLQHSVSADQLIELMTKLEMCFKLDEGNESSGLFLPALFDDGEESAAKGERKLAWKMSLADRSFTCLGRRLQIENEYTTFLSPGFFPRLQVHLRNYFYEKSWTANAAFTVERNLIQFSAEGVEVCVEYSGGTDYFLDILVQSQMSYEKTLGFIKIEVVSTIRRFCASPQGCQGVVLVEAVIRPCCVEGLHLCKDRKVHSVLVSQLEGKLKAKGNDTIHTWSQELEGADSTDLVFDLLKGDGAYDQSISSLKVAPEEYRSSGIRELSEVELPKHFYPTVEDVHVLSRLNASLNVAKVLPIKLHIVCDYTKTPHKVPGQQGRQFHLNWKNGGYHWSIAKVAVTLVWTAVGVGTSVAGVPQVGFSHVEKFIEDSFAVDELPVLDVETLNRTSNHGKAEERVSEEDILKALGKYWKLDPHTEELKQFLKLENLKGFWNDFQLHKVEYLKDPNHNDRIGWVCDKHFEEGKKQKRLRSRPH